MDQQALPFRIDPMTPADIPGVMEVEQTAYSMHWPRKAFDQELADNQLAHYFVLRVSTPQQSHQKPAARAEKIIGLGGFWLIYDEIHINTLAIHPDWRRLGLGEWMLIALLEAGQRLGGQAATLEVRPSNQPARSLYQKYRFHQAGRRPNYYSDNGEDALILTTSSLALPGYQAMFAQRKEALYQRLAKIDPPE